MARLPRVRLPGYAMHVVIRGNDRRHIFVGDGDKIFFHRTVAEASRKFGMRVHAYVFMPNHVHLLVSGNDTESVSRTIQALGRRYVAYFNFLHKRTGTLWQGRFHSCVVDTDRYFLTCQRYIEMNPVRASLCGHPRDYEWSSYRHYAEGAPDDLVTPHSLHAEMRLTTHAYRRLFDEVLPQEDIERIRDCARHGWALGGESFRERLAGASGRRSDRIKTGRRRKAELSKLESDPNYQSTSLRFSR